MCRTNEHLLPGEDGAPPWRRPSFRPLVIALGVFALFDVTLIAFVVLR